MSSLFSDEEWSPESVAEADLTGLEGTCCYCDAQAEKAIWQCFNKLPLNAIHWIDGGDYHYLTEIWMRRIKKPFSLLLLDNHPDDQPPAFAPDILSCGGWVEHARRTNPFLSEDQDLVYLSIDIDILSRDYARTNWNQGSTTLPELLDSIDYLVRGKDIAGIDVCGGITLAQGGTSEDFAINRKTREILRKHLERLL